MTKLEIFFASLSALFMITTYIFAMKARKYAKLCDEVNLIEKVENCILNDKELNNRESFNIEDVKQIITFSVDEKIIQQALFDLYRKGKIFYEQNIENYKNINNCIEFTTEIAKLFGK